MDPPPCKERHNLPYHGTVHTVEHLHVEDQTYQSKSQVRRPITRASKETSESLHDFLEGKSIDTNHNVVVPGDHAITLSYLS